MYLNLPEPYGVKIMNLTVTNYTLVCMAESKLERELKMIRQRLESIEEALGEEMTSDDKQALESAIKEHKEGKTIPFTRSKARKH